jgi:uncharacterized protein (TIGR03435 family)
MRIVTVFAVTLIARAALSAQAPTAPAFEVATIRVSKQTTGLRGGSCSGTEPSAGGPIAAMAAGRGIAAAPPGVCQFTSVTLKNLIGEAYGLGLEPGDELTGGPAWLGSTRFDVRAKAEEPRPRAELRLMMRTLLADRFGLAMHDEARQTDGFALVVAEGGPKLTKASGTGAKQGMTRIAGKPLTASNTTMAQLARTLAGSLGRPVVDATGLSDRYNFTLTWTPGDEERGPFAGLSLPPEIREKMRGAADPNGPTIYTALREQLGLRLQPRQVPRDIMVIDRVSMPSEN